MLEFFRILQTILQHLKKGGIMRLNLIANTFFFFGILISTESSALQENKWTHFGTRPLAMGNAFVAVSDDFNALFYNPAGLARLKEWDGDLFLTRFSVGQNSTETFSDLLNWNAETGQSSTTKRFIDLFEKKTGKNQHVSISFTPNIVFPNFGFAVVLESLFNMTTHSDLDIDVYGGLEGIVPLSFAKNFLHERLSIGITTKLRYFLGVDHSYDIGSVSEIAEAGGENNSGAYAGWAPGVDLGLLFTPTEKFEPTIGISITDVGGSTYNALGNSVAPKIKVASLNTGISFKPYKNDFSYAMISVDAHSINRPTHYSHKFKIGAEFGFSSIFKIQTGISDGYLTGGCELDIKLLTLRYANYAVDHGAIVGLNENLIDRRHLIELKLLI